MFACCVRRFRPREQDQTADSDCCWKAGDRSEGYSTGDNHPSDDHPRGLRPPVFYIDSGDSTDTDAAPNPTQPGRRGHVTRSAAKLDPNSQLQRKSRLHNEKLPSFSALDRTKRPRARRDEARHDSDCVCSVTVYEPLTFETFRSNTPPLAVIAPLSNPYSDVLTDTRSRNTDSSQQTAERLKHYGKKSGFDLNTSVQFSHRQGWLKYDGRQDSSESETLHTRGKEEEEDVSLHGLINEAYSSEEDGTHFVPPQNILSTSSSSWRQGQDNAGPGLAQRPTTLHLPVLKTTNSSFSSRQSVESILPAETSSCVESAVDSDTLSHTLTEQRENAHSQTVQREDTHSKTVQAEDTHSQTVQPEDTHSRTAQPQEEERSAHTTDSGDPVCPSVVVASPSPNSNYNPHKLLWESAPLPPTPTPTPTPANPTTPATQKKVPPQKPKRKNPPSNVSTAASRQAIQQCLVTSGTMTSEAVTSAVMTSGSVTSEAVTSGSVTSEAVTSEEVTSVVMPSEAVTSVVMTSEAVTSDRLRHGEEEGPPCVGEPQDSSPEIPNGLLLTPPHCFMDMDYAGFESFDEFNGSLV